VSARLAALALALFATDPGAQVVDGVAAVVDDQVILLSEVETKVERVARRMERQAGTHVSEDMLQKLRLQAIDALIEDRLLLARAKQLQLDTAPDEVDAAIARIASEEGTDVEAIYRAAESQGLPREAYRNEIGEQIMRLKLIDQAVRPRITTTEEEIRRLFVERYGTGAGIRVRARHLLVPWPLEGEAPREEAILAATRLREMALQGAPFEDLARRFSAAPSGPDGGLTVFRGGEVLDELAPFVFEGPLGAISEPIPTQHGVHLIQLLERFDPSQVKLEDVRDRLRAELESKQTVPVLDEYLRELRRDHYVEVVAPSLK
jgi:peptidyl-prolyl cis-trans isomerase SurA